MERVSFGSVTQCALALGVSPEQVWASVREICCLTGSDGNPIERERWGLFSDYWVGPYERLLRDWTQVAWIPGGTAPVIGYLTGCPNSGPFELARSSIFVPWLFSRILTGFYPFDRDVVRTLRRESRIERSPWETFSSSARDLVSRSYPAHLHMNLRSEWRGRGIGEGLMHRFLVELRAQGTPGLYLLCGEGPLKFYFRQHFSVLEKVHFGPHLVPVFLLTRSV